MAAKKFTAALERMKGRLGWTIAYIPFDTAKVWGGRGQIKVKGTINGFPLRATLFPTGRGTHYLLVNKKMQKGGRVKAGATAEFRLEPDTEERVIEVPPELTRLLAEEKSLRKYHDRLSHAIRREIAKWVALPKSTEARTRRAEQIAERLMETMEAERDLPPLIRRALDANGTARAGWDAMLPSQRRLQLMAVFYYRSPEARARRLQKVVEMAEEYGRKRAK